MKDKKFKYYSRWDETLMDRLIDSLPEELAEEGSTGQDLINTIIYKAKEEERILHETNLHKNFN